MKDKLDFLFKFLVIAVGNLLFVETLPTFENDFNKAMSPSLNYKPEIASKNSAWALVKENYNIFIKFAGESSSEMVRIPKIIHQIWLGSPLPERCKKFQKTWIKYHPDWEYRLWTAKEINEFKLQNKNLYDSTNNYGAKSDIARYEILYRIGGFYADTDFECLRSFDILHHSCDFYAGLGYTSYAYLFNGLIGSAPGNLILKECIQTMKSGRKRESVNEIMKRTGPGHFTRCFFRKVLQCPGVVVAFPLTYFYPWPAWLRHDRDPEKIRSWIRPESFAVHHWHVSWNK